MTKKDAVERLDRIVPDDTVGREAAHQNADEILLEYLKTQAPEVAEAWERAQERFDGFWYA